jgi:hypothetical protein
MLNKDFKEFVALLNQNKVDYLVVGGYAVAIHGHPRYTKDLDIWLWVDKQNADNMMTVLTEFGFSSLDLSAEDFLTKGYVIQLGQPPNRIDLLTQVDGLEFELCYPEKVIVDIEGVAVNFIDLENLKKNKLATGRFQDLADLENLQ